MLRKFVFPMMLPLAMAASAMANDTSPSKGVDLEQQVEKADSVETKSQPEDRSEASASVQQDVDKSTESETEKQRKKLVEDAVSAVSMTRDALKALDDGKKEEALETLEKVTGKLELVLARDPALAMVPVSVTTTIYDVLAKTETVKTIANEAEKALDEGRVQDARRLLNNLASEVVVSTTNLPMATYPDAIKHVAPLIDSGKIDEAKQQLQLALKLLVVTDVVMPLPTTRANVMLKEAETLAEKKDRSKEENDRLMELLKEVREQVEFGRELGYFNKDRAKSIYDDNATNRQILDEMVSHWGMHPTLSDGAASALREMELAAHRDQPFDLVILDAMMPVVDGFQLAEVIRQRPDLHPGTVMMLSAADRPNSTAKCGELGIATYLVKPVSASALLEAILSTLGQDRVSRGLRLPNSHESGGQRSLLQQKAKTRLRILLVDDHEPNRRLVESILSKRGHEVQSESDGDAAIRACCDTTFDVVLMDVQMPGRNGFSATRAIRQLEQCSGGHVPIVALTAHALTGDREKCLDAGMNDYLSKPIHAAELIEVVERIAVGPSAGGDCASNLQVSQSQGFSIEAALRRMGGERDLLQEHLGYVLSDMPQLIATMKTSVDTGDAKQLTIAAHRLKSLVSSYDHAVAHELTQSLESDAKNGDLSHAEERFAKLEPNLQAFARTIDDYLQNM
ncbi:MAG TPA: YfdX family protein [Pirellula sp.]|nr:YfdX family protein [Pirellula sp.]